MEATTDVDPKGIPTPAILADVEAVVEFDPDDTLPLNERGRRPLGVHNIDFLPVEPLDVDIIYNGVVGFNTSTEDAIEAALSDELSDIRPFVAAADISSNQNDRLNVNSVISIAQTLLDATQSFSGVEVFIDGSPVLTDYLFTEGKNTIFELSNF